ncbi:hypothetical protein H5410_003186 [Solanum commersonii]|uniref:Gag-pol polyprotein n=1 Tax=Solanum commersonii TaxID=4109 RepID=A0A9J6B3Z5_SOLCO|nr:hypothetical protein H5410_003186 [Solanum commersonii]
MSVHEYTLKFMQLSRYALEMVADVRSRMSLFVSRLSRLLSQEGKTSMFIGEMDIPRLMIHVESNRPAPSSASALAPKNRGEFRNKNFQNFRARPIQSQGSVAQGANWTPTCTKCGRNHLGVGRHGSNSCFNYGQIGHFMRECPKNRQGNVNWKIEPNLLPQLR